VRLLLLCVGKPRDATAIELHDRYARRARRLGLSYEAAAVPDVPAGKRYSAEHAREREAAVLLGRLASHRGRTVALEAGGRMLDSPALARQLERWAPHGINLVIGGPTGLHRKLLDRADDVWSLSRLTFPHELVRVLVAEQVYRAMTLLRGAPYHK